MTEFITQHKLNGWRKNHRCIHSAHRERSDRVEKLTVEEVALSRAIPTNCVSVFGARFDCVSYTNNRTYPQHCSLG